MHTFQTLLGVVAEGAEDGGFSFGTLLLYVGGALLLAFFCSLGFIARIRDRRAEQRKDAERLDRSRRPPSEGTGDR